MKKLYYLGLAAMLAMSACTSEEPGGGDNGNAEGNHFLAVNIVATPNNGGSKAEGDQMDGDPGDALYEEGYAKENKVESVRFYFFDLDGNAASVRANSSINYFDWANPESDGEDMPNVEKQLKATVVIHAKDANSLPAQILAVINPSQVTDLDAEPKSLTQIRGIIQDFVAAAKVSTDKKGAFVMINSVYSQGGEVVANSVPRSSYQVSEELAINNPINIYVERCVAKVRMHFNHDTDSKIEYIQHGSPTTGQYYLAYLKDAKGQYITAGDGRKVCLRVNGWNITAETDRAYMSKHIDTNWAADLFGTREWNWSAYFRSYWAINAPDAQQTWHDYNSIAADGSATGTEIDQSIYTNENAPDLLANEQSTGGSIEKFTKVIISGQLVDEKNAPIEICKYAGLNLVGKDNLKTALLQQLKMNGMIYFVTNDADGKHYHELTEGDVEFVTAMTAGQAQAGESNTGRYFVYLQLSEAGKAKIWSSSNEENQNTTETYYADAAAVNKYFVEHLGRCQIYETGRTYYYFPIRHLADESTQGKKGYYGVVRNHIYDCVINSIIGLGTPVYDPEEVIYPEKPTDEDTYIGARIRILSWRVVPNNIDLKW